MAELPEVSPGEIIASDHINDIMLRAVMRYASIADRTAENPTPVAGEMAYMDAEGGSPERLAFFDGSTWVGMVSNGVRVFAADGSEPLPGYTFFADQDTGIWRSGPNQMSVVTGASERLRFQSDGNVSGPTTGGVLLVRPAVGGLPTAPTYSFSNDTASGMYRRNAEQLALSVAGADFLWSSTVRTFLPLSYLDTTGIVADATFISADGRLGRSTSARKYKTDIAAAPQLAALPLEPVTFHRDDDDADFIGFIADDMPDERMIVRDADGEVANFDLRAVVAVLAAKVNELTARVEALEA